VRETRTRSLVKAIVYRITMLVVASLIIYDITRNILQSVKLSAVYFFGAAIIYYIYERAWNMVSWGKIDEE